MASVAGVVSAAPTSVVYNYTGETDGGVVMGIATPDYTGGAYVGEFNMTTTTPGFNNILTYCTDVGAILNNSYTYTPTPLSSATGVSPTWISGGIQNAATLWYDNKGAVETAGTYSVAIQTAGLQLAIWDLLYNSFTGKNTYTAANFFTKNTTSFYLTSTTDTSTLDAVAYADSLLNNFGGASSDTNLVEWLQPQNDTGSQGLLVAIPGTTGNPPVPETASTVALFGMALAALGVARSRFASANKA
jgi:hypothetical protein